MASGRAESIAGVDDVDLSETTALVTGATSGIGRETALALGGLGATVLVHGRDRSKGEAVCERLRESGAEAANLYLTSFEDLDAVEKLATEITDEHGPIDVLVNNAGGYFSDGARTPDGIERTFAVNHLAPFVLTARLLPGLRDTGGRVVTVSSEAHRGGELPIDGDRGDDSGAQSAVSLDRDGLRSIAEYNGWDAYCRSKLANVLFTTELARRLPPAQVTANCCHPGVVLGSGFTRNMALPARLMTVVLSRTPSWVPTPVVDTSAEAAATQTYLAASPEVADVTGGYFKECERADPEGVDEDLARALWEESVELADLDPESLPSPE
jgi:NAD(P)-dependent dehydrogenase (short-subunit alcohol dehydrogenase family)